MQCLGVYHYLAVSAAGTICLIVGIAMGTAISAPDAYKAGVANGMDASRERQDRDAARNYE